VFEPNELVEKLVRWCPGPVRYHGVLVPNARLRKAVEAGRPAPRSQGPTIGARIVSLHPSLRCRRLTWAELMRPVFSKDVLVRHNCLGRVRALTATLEPAGKRAILDRRHLPSRAPLPSPAVTLLEEDLVD